MAVVGRTLVVLGVAVWPAWGILSLAGWAHPVGWALAAHLALVVPGSILVRRHAGIAARSPSKRLGEVLIALGILAWLPYFALRERGADVSSLPFLLWHLAGVVPGAILRYTNLGARPRVGSAQGPNGPEAPN